MGLQVNLHAILSNKIFNQLVNLADLFFYHGTPQHPVLIPHKNKNSWFLPLDSKYQNILQKWAEYLDREYVLKFKALTEVVER